jgi:hypothetical protein
MLANASMMFAGTAGGAAGLLKESKTFAGGLPGGVVEAVREKERERAVYVRHESFC